MIRKKSLHCSLQERVYGGVSAGSTLRKARGSRSFVQRLQRDHTLTGHSGCVNTISWSDSGELLLSGSDDCKLNIYNPTTKKLVQSIRSGHRANVFSAKFLPCTGNKGIVSCAGDGMIQYTDVEREATYGQYQFNCHSGTTYDVVTTPGDPNTFLTCGEDGTVRLFDLRTKTKCICRECKDDVLLDCGKAVTSISVNPTTPYHLAVGCEDSVVRVFDRRALTTNSQSSGVNKLQGLFSQFKPEPLQDRMCRVTSLQYSNDGSELLVSYCADYVYLFNLLGQRMVYSKHDGTDQATNGFHSAENGAQRNVPPLKRLRLRGDWSDTGPNARPESEHPSEENSLMQRMSDMFARWLEESFRAGQRRRAQSSQQHSVSSDSSTSSQPSASPDYSSSSSVDSSWSGMAGEATSSPEQLNDVQDSSIDELSLASAPADSNNSESCSANETLHTTAPTNPQSAEGNSDNSSSNQDTLERKSEENKFADSDVLRDTNTNSYEVIQHTAGTTLKSDVDGAAASTRCNCHEGSECRCTSGMCSECHTQQQAAQSGEGKTRQPVDRKVSSASTQCAAAAHSNRTKHKAECKLHSKRSDSRSKTDSRTDPGFVTQRRAYFESMEKRDVLSSKQPSVDASDCNSKKTSQECHLRDSSESSSTRETSSEIANKKEMPSTSSLPSVRVEQVDGNPVDSADQMETNESGISNTGIPTQSGVCTRGETSAGPQADSVRDEGDSGISRDSRSAAATRIQRMFRQRRMFKAFSDEKEEGEEYWMPEMMRMYKGHRNARTMIKEASFWGDHHIVSGSDCGRIFIWDKHTAEIVAILQGDRHVVNCVQPHPFDPVLASSGIDYDVKIWAPTAVEPLVVTDADEIVRRNEKMLEESRDTITVPASFMLRMLASLNHSRFTRRNRDNDSDSDSSDDG